MADQMASMLMGGDSDSDDDSNGDVQVVGQGSVAPNPNPVAPLPVAATINPVMQNVASPQVAKSLVPQQRPPPQRAPVPVQQTTQPQRPPMSTPPGVSAPANPAVPMRSNIGVGSSSTNTATSSIAMNNPQQQRRVSASMQTNVIRQQPSSNPSSRHSQPHSSHTPATINPISSNRQPHSGTDTSVGVGQPIPTQRSRQTSSTSVYSQNTHVSASSSARTPTASSLSTPSNTVQQPYSTNTSHIRQSTPAPAPKVPAFDFEPTPIAELKRKSQPQQLQAPVQQQQQASIQQPSRHHPMHSNTNRQTQQHQISQVSRQQHSSSQHPMRTQGSTSTHQPSSSSRSHYQSASSSARATHASETSKNRKEEFLMFTKVLMKYLEQKDKEMHLKARHVIKECARKNKEGDPAFSSLSASMQKELKKLVDRKQGANYWSRAEEYLRQWLYNSYKKKKYSDEEAKRKATFTAKQASLPLDQSLSPYFKDQTLQPASITQPSSTVQMQQHQQRQMQKEQQGQVPQHQSQEQQKAVEQNQEKEKIQPATKKAKAETKPVAAKKAAKKKTPAPKGKTATTKKKNARKTPTSPEKKSTAKESSKPVPTEPKEYQEAMEMLNHVVDYDVSTIGLILGNLNGNKHKEDIDISEEQRKLLYDDFGITKIKPRRGLYGGDKSRIASPTSVAPEKDDEGDSSSKLPLYIQGWDKRNIVSARIAWAKLRLMEDELEEMEQTSSKLPTLQESNQKPTEVKSKDEKDEKDSTPDVSDGSWFNDEMAEQDETLALISEATQYYIRTALEGAMNLAKKRANIEGVRLMNQKHLFVAENQMNQTAKNRKPPLMLRLGCDTRRQYSMVQGNAAKTSQRFEEALERQEDMKPMNQESMRNASSMEELSTIPRLPSAAKNAEVNAKRIFEVHGGKHATEPPLGRVPKKMKITAKDFSSCINQPSFAVSKRQVLTNSFI